MTSCTIYPDNQTSVSQVPQASGPREPGTGRLPHYLQRLVDPEASADFPPAKQVSLKDLDNRELDKLVATLGRNNATWRRYVPAKPPLRDACNMAGNGWGNQC